MRYLLDTNILVFFFTAPAELHRDIRYIIDDYESQLYTSSVCVQELIHLIQIGKVQHKCFKKIEDIFMYMQQAGIHIAPITEKHLREYANLPLDLDHRDPMDRLIVAQAISDKISLISSDHNFERYRKVQLKFIHNKR